MSAVFMVADTKGGKGSLSTGKITPATKSPHNPANDHHDCAMVSLNKNPESLLFRQAIETTGNYGGA
jgi:hypothetical protein